MSPPQDTRSPMCLWLSFLKRGAGPGLYIRLGFWLRGAVAYQKIFLSAFRADAELREAAPDVQDAVERLSYELPAGAPADIAMAAPDSRWWRAGIAPACAAAVVLAAALTLIGFSYSRDGAVYSTEVGGFERVPLPDGSVLELNTNTEVRVRFSEGRRDVELVRGEANFSVAHDSHRPFIVSTEQTAVRAVGTEFGVRIYEPKRVGVIVTEGRVTVSDTPRRSAALGRVIPGNAPADVSRAVSAGEVATDSAGILEVSQVGADEIERLGAWRKGTLKFKAQPLSEVIAEFNRYSSRRLVIADGSIANIRLSGAFPSMRVDSFVKLLEGYGIHAGEAPGQPNTIELRRARPNSP